MRKIISILLVSLILFSGVTIHLASHLCGSSIDTRVSFSGKLAGCGMEHQQKDYTDYTFSNKCCDDLTSSVTLNNNYFASSSTSLEHNLQLSYIIALRTEILPEAEASFQLSEIFTRPPGSDIPNEVDQKLICIYRI